MGVGSMILYLIIAMILLFVYAVGHKIYECSQGHGDFICKIWGWV